MLERINLVPQRALAERIRLATPPVVGGLLALIIIFLAINDKLLQRRLKSIDREIAIAQQQSDDLLILQVKAGQLKGAVAKEREAIKNLVGEAAKFTGVEQRKRHFSPVLAAIIEALPGSVRCEKIRFEKDGGLISGTALLYREPSFFFSKLADNPLFSEVTLQDMDQAADAGKTGYAFTIAFTLKQGN